MKKLYDQLKQDVRFVEGLKACINCGTCTAICPAATFYDYEPRTVVDIVQTKDDEAIESLLKSDTIWYCGECMSCVTRCPRSNAPGLVIIALRSLSQDLGYFVESEKGRQQLAIKRTVGESTLKNGYCVYIDNVSMEMHPEQGPVWEWELANKEEVMKRMMANYKQDGAGALRKIPQWSLDELQKIFDITGGTKRFETIENFSRKKAKEMNLEFGEGIDNEYFQYVYLHNNNNHNRK